MKKKYYSPSELLMLAPGMRERLIRLIQENKWTTSKAAREVGVTRFVVGNFINSSRIPRTDYLYKFLEFFEEMDRVSAK